MINLNDDETSSAVQTFSHEARLLETTRTQTLSEKSKMASIWINHKIEIFSACARLWLRSPDVKRKKFQFKYYTTSTTTTTTNNNNSNSNNNNNNNVYSILGFNVL